ncbi:MAG: phosphatidylglycerophosphatase A, partial [Acidimicrobiia bacterium]
STQGYTHPTEAETRTTVVLGSEPMPRLIASWFGSGLILGSVRGSDSGSGTVGSVFAAVVVIVAGVWWGWAAQLIGTVLVVIAGYWSVAPFTDTEGDAGWIVVDEAAGTFLALIGLTTWPAVVVGFVVFRAADIFKRGFPGVAATERLPGASGVIGDDLVAGVYGLLAGHIAQSLL